MHLLRHGGPKLRDYAITFGIAVTQANCRRDSLRVTRIIAASLSIVANRY